MSPYIDRESRVELEGRRPATVGELTYLLTLDVDDYLREQGESFQTYAEIIAALEATKLELYRRRLGGYEDAKLLLNGDVYGR